MQEKEKSLKQSVANKKAESSGVETKSYEFAIKKVGIPAIQSPLADLKHFELSDSIYVSDRGNRVILDSNVNVKEFPDIKSFERAGPRSKIFYDPEEVKAGIVTCGGICPGLNDVIRSVVLELEHWYKVRKIIGFKYGYAGLVPNSRHQPIPLTPEIVESIHLRGGSILGSSRGTQPIKEMVKNLVDRNINMLFCIGIKALNWVHNHI